MGDRMPRPPRRPRIRRALRLALVASVTLFAVVAAGVVWLGSAPGKNWLRLTLEEALSSPDTSVQIASLRGDLYSRIILEGVEVSDRRGVWLRAPSVDITWRAGDLLRGRLVLTDAQISGASLVRPPESGEQGSAALPTLPVAMDVRKLVAGFDYGETAYAVTVTDFVLDNSRAAGQILLADQQGRDRFQVEGEWRGAKAPFTINAQLEAPEKGLIHDMMPLPYRGVAQFSVRASGQANGWSGEMTLDVPGQLEIDGTATGGNDGTRLVLRQMHNRLLGELGAPFPGDDAVVEVRISRDKDQGWPFKAVVNGGALGAEVSGSFAAKDGYSVTGGQFSLNSPSFVRGEVSAEGAAISGDFALADGRLETSYTLAADRVAASGQAFSELRAEGTAALTDATAEGTLKSLQFVGMRGKVPGSVAEESGNWSVDFPSREWRIDIESFDLGPVTLKNTELEGSQQTITRGTARLNVANLAALGTGFPIGEMTAAIEVIGLSSGTVAVQMVSEAIGVFFNDERLDALVGAVPSLELDGTVDMQGGGLRATIDALTLTGAGLKATLNGSVSRSTVDLQFGMDVADVRHLTESSISESTSLAISGHVGGTPRQPVLSASSRLAEVAGYGIVLTDVATSFTLAASDSTLKHWQGQGVISGANALGPARTDIDLALGMDGTLDAAARITHPVLSGTVSVARTPSGRLEAALDAAARPVEQDGLNVTGEALLTARYTQDRDQGTLSIGFDSEALRIVSGALPPVEVARARGTVTAQRIAGDWLNEADLTIENARAGFNELTSLVVTSDEGKSDIRVTGKGRVQHPLSFDFVLKPAENQIDLTGEAYYAGHRIGADESIRVGFVGPLNLQAPRVSIGDGLMALSAVLSADNIGADMTLTDIDLGLVNLAFPGMVKHGQASGHVKATWQRGRTEKLDVSLALSGMTFQGGGFVGLQAETAYNAEISAQTQPATILLMGAVTAGNVEVGTIKGNIPYRFDPDTRLFEIRAGAPLSGSLNWQGGVDPLWHLLGVTDHNLDGDIKGVLSVDGTLEAPVFSGSLELDGGRYEYLPLGLVASIDRLSIAGNDQQIRLDTLEATDDSGGRISSQGAFDLSSRLTFPGRLTIRMQDFQVARLDSLQGKVSADLVYERSETGDVLKGEVTTGRLNAFLPKELPVSVVELDVVEIGREDDDADSTVPVMNSRQKLGKPTSLDVAIKVPDRFFVEGRGLFSEWRGDLTLGGTTADPRLAGDIILRNGFLQFGGKKIDLEQGQLGFRGRRGFDPDLSLSARYVASTIDATMSVSGSLSAPKWTMSSTPELPEDEIMARILIGRSVAELSAIQVAELASAINTLRGSRGTDVLGRLRRGLGLDTLSIERDEESEEGHTLVSGGKYLRDNIYLELETTPASNEAAARLQVEITKRLAVETEVGLRQRGRLRLKWFWEY